ncbi:flagellin [Nocardioides sp. J9]|uniref:flagellin N-terminal helical domain-containing protein n=1 Tax=unclassified Nocardioides TaxID=2615069 RepID=UPI00048E4744|nr:MULTISPECIES: flagellin [unclassified Nocardioides]TWG98639.1 flagellin [Nocardioides sp. J9]
MGLRINQNIEATNAYRNLSVTQNQLSKSMEKLSSGFRINRAADDAAGLAISEGLRAQVGGLKVAVRNAQDGVSVAQTAEGALTEVHSMLQRMNDLAVQKASGTVETGSDAEQALVDEFTQLETEITRIKDNTKFNGVALFADTALTFQTGYDSGDTIDISATALADFTAGTAMAAIDIDDSNTLQAAINEVSAQRAELGAIQNRFEHTINNVNVAIENLSASESRIRDTDMAQEMMNLTRSQILSQAGTAMLAQANSAPNGVLQLLRG